MAALTDSQKIVPPVLPFALGSLGFLTNFDFAQYKKTMDKVIDDGIRVNLRMRFTCTVYRAIAPEEAALAVSKGGRKRKAIKKPGGEILINQVDKAGWDAVEGPVGGPFTPCQEKNDKEIMCFSTRPVEQFEVLNDLVVDRGPSPFVSLLEVFGESNCPSRLTDRRRASPHYCPSRWSHSLHADRFHCILSLCRRITRAPADPGHPPHPDLSTHPLLPTYAPAR
jgi:hypothetical protein